MSYGGAPAFVPVRRRVISVSYTHLIYLHQVLQLNQRSVTDHFLRLPVPVQKLYPLIHTADVYKRQILIIEDDKAVKNLIATTLEMHDYHYTWADKGEQGILSAASQRPCLLYTSFPQGFLCLLRQNIRTVPVHVDLAYHGLKSGFLH